jgi:hypothetical protein
MALGFVQRRLPVARHALVVLHQQAAGFGCIAGQCGPGDRLDCQAWPIPDRNRGRGLR